jgi:hypothetical protein
MKAIFIEELVCNPLFLNVKDRISQAPVIVGKGTLITGRGVQTLIEVLMRLL